MTKEIWINLPVKDIDKTKEFFTKIGFKANPGMGNTPVSTSFILGSKSIVFMFFAEDVFKTITKSEISDSKKSAEVLFSFDAQSREEVDEWSMKVKDAGGIVYDGPGENQGWMYGFGFADLDGHRWNVLYMDMSKMPKG